MALQVRELTPEEHTKIGRLIRSQSAPLRLVRRATIIHLATGGLGLRAIARQLRMSPHGVRPWIDRFNQLGLDGLADAPRSGRPPTYDEARRSQVVAKARGLPSKPASGEVPATCHWTLDLLQRELHRDGLPIKRSQIRRILQDEHIAWQRPRTWLESDDPDFAGKGPGSSASTRTRHRRAPSSA
jgi:transposase